MEQRIPSPFDYGFLKGGAGSGNFGHSGRPGQVGGSSSEGGPQATGMGSGPSGRTPQILTDMRADHRDDVARAADAAYIQRLQDFHGLTVKTSSEKVDPVTILSTHETLAALPPGARNYMKEKDIRIRIIHPDDQAPPTFKVNNEEFIKGGHADYRYGEVVMYDTKSPSSYEKFARAQDIIAHESGHFAIWGLAGVAAKGNDLETRWEETKDAVREASAKFGYDSPESIAAKEIRDKAHEEYKPYQELNQHFRDFGNATHNEGGFSPYADSYVKDDVRGGASDITEYVGPTKSQYYKELVNGVLRRVQYGFSRATNENFAEIFAAAYKNKGLSKGLTLLSLKDTKPKTYEAYKKLDALLSNKFEVVQHMHVRR